MLGSGPTQYQHRLDPVRQARNVKRREGTDICESRSDRFPFSLDLLLWLWSPRLFRNRSLCIAYVVRLSRRKGRHPGARAGYIANELLGSPREPARAQLRLFRSQSAVVW